MENAGSRKSGNPIGPDGKPTLCGSAGCLSPDHCQFSGRCPGQMRYEENGTAKNCMAASFAEDLNNGAPMENILAELLCYNCNTTTWQYYYMVVLIQL